MRPQRPKSKPRAKPLRKHTLGSFKDSATASPHYNLRRPSFAHTPPHKKPKLTKPLPILFPLLSLPNELILLVADNLPVADLNSLLRTNHRLASLLETSINKLAVADVHSRHFKWPWRTKLIWAADRGYTGLVKRLLKHCDNISYQDDTKRTALHTAIDNGHEEIVRLLLEGGADVTLQCRGHGRTPLHVATVSRLGTVEMVEMLLEKGANPSAEDIYGYTPLHCALRFRGNEPDVEGMVEAMLAKGADVAATGNYKRMSPLHCAAFFGNAEAIRLLLEYGADVTLEDAYGRTAMELVVCSVYHGEATKYLVGKWPRETPLPINLVSSCL